MKKISLVILGFLFLTSLCFAKAQNAYHNKEGHFSFTVPGGWKEYSQSESDALGRYTSQKTGITISYIAAFSKHVKGGLAAITIQMNNRKKYSGEGIKQFVTPTNQQATVPHAVKELVKNIPMDFGKYVYDKERNIAFRKSESYAGGKKIIGVDAVIFSNYGFITLNFNTKEENFATASNDFNQIMDSFKFDKGYGY